MSDLPLPPPSSSPHSKAAGTPPAHWSYEATVSRIETIITRIEAGDLELADVFAQFASAVEHLQQCETFLHQQQQQMDLLIETLMDESETF